MIENIKIHADLYGRPMAAFGIAIIVFAAISAVVVICLVIFAGLHPLALISLVGLSVIGDFYEPSSKT